MYSVTSYLSHTKRAAVFWTARGVAAIVTLLMQCNQCMLEHCISQNIPL